MVEKPSNIEWQQNVEVVNLGSFHDAAPCSKQSKCNTPIVDFAELMRDRDSLPTTAPVFSVISVAVLIRAMTLR